MNPPGSSRIGAGTAATCGQRFTRRPFMSMTTAPCWSGVPKNVYPLQVLSGS